VLIAEPAPIGLEPEDHPVGESALEADRELAGALGGVELGLPVAYLELVELVGLTIEPPARSHRHPRRHLDRGQRTRGDVALMGVRDLVVP
jgi:hypothetical protein